jgi:hypothetical protein
MAILIEGLLVLMAAISIISFFSPKKSEKKDETNNKVGLYEVELEIDGEKINVRSEVELLKRYDLDDIYVKHINTFNHYSSEMGQRVYNILESEHSLLKKDDVKWEI